MNEQKKQLAIKLGLFATVALTTIAFRAYGNRNAIKVQPPVKEDKPKDAVENKPEASTNASGSSNNSQKKNVIKIPVEKNPVPTAHEILNQGSPKTKVTVREFKAGDKIDPKTIEQSKEKREKIKARIADLKNQLEKLPKNAKGYREGLSLRNEMALCNAQLFYI